MSFEIQETGNPTYAEVAEVFSRAREVLVVDGWTQGGAANDGRKCAAGALTYVVSGEVAQMYAVMCTPECPTINIDGTETLPDPDVIPFINILRQETGFPSEPPYRWNDMIKHTDSDFERAHEDATQIVLAKFDEIIEKYQLLASPS